MLTSQRKLMGVLAALIVLGVLAAGLVAERSIRRDQLAQIQASLEARARLVLDQAEELEFDAEHRLELDALARRAAAAATMRVTFMASDGTVLGDSEVPPSRLAAVENHATRPEVRAALTGRVGTGIRRSNTVGRELLYVALPVERDGVVRVAVSLSEVDAAVAALRRRLALGAAFGLLIALVFSFVVARLALSPLTEVRRAAEAIARGELDERPPLAMSDELGEISNAIRQMANQLRLRLDEANQEKEQLRAVLESMVEGVLVVDAKGTVILANSRLREFFDVTGEMVGRRLLEGIRHPELDALLREIPDDEEGVTRTFVVGKTPRTLSAHAARFPQGGGPRTGSVVVLHDISELERLESVRRDFVANASHELRTPLTAIQGFAATLLGAEGLSDEERRSALEVIERHSQRLASIVDDLLALATVQIGKLRLEPTLLDVGAIARSVIHDLEPRFAERDLRVSCEVVGDPEAWADPRALEQILTNLLDNAFKYSEPGGEVVVTVDGEGERVRVSVRDRGIGIPDEDLARIFERFYRVDKARSRALGGTGLGLSIVKHLVQTLGGEISVESRLGEGSRFSFGLPRTETRA